MAEATLIERMRQRAETDVEHRDALLAHASALEAVTTTETPIPKLVGTWARARRFWHDLTGEPLI